MRMAGRARWLDNTCAPAIHMTRRGHVAEGATERGKKEAVMLKSGQR